jgi:two-component system nitrogen regulation response regulator NtrX
MRVAVRVISATNCDLQALVSQDKFREDLFYRLSVVPIRVPPLRERREDIRALAEYFLTEFCTRNNFRRKSLDEDVFSILERYAWPGNARELKNVVERMAILSVTDRICSAAVPAEIRLIPEADARSNLQQARESAERESILKALEQTSWNVAGAARILGIERTNLHKRIRALGISKGET